MLTPLLLAFSTLTAAVLSMFPIITDHPQCLPWKRPLPADCHYILAHLPSIELDTAFADDDNSLRSTSTPFFPWAMFHHRSCVMDLNYISYNRSSAEWSVHRYVPPQTIARIWAGLKAGCQLIVRDCIENGGSGTYWTTLDSDAASVVHVHIVIGNESTRMESNEALQRLAFQGRFPLGMPRSSNTFKKAVYHL